MVFVDTLDLCFNPTVFQSFSDIKEEGAFKIPKNMAISDVSLLIYERSTKTEVIKLANNLEGTSAKLFLRFGQKHVSKIVGYMKELKIEGFDLLNQNDPRMLHVSVVLFCIS